MRQSRSARQSQARIPEASRERSLGAFAAAFTRLVREACRPKWNVYAKRPFGGRAQVLAYLSRYTHRIAIGDRRILKIDEDARTVTFAYKDYADHNKRKTMTLSLREFLRRFCLHILPCEFVKIRHYGLLANRGATNASHKRASSSRRKMNRRMTTLSLPNQPNPTQCDRPVRTAVRCACCSWTSSCRHDPARVATRHEHHPAPRTAFASCPSDLTGSPRLCAPAHQP